MTSILGYWNVESGIIIIVGLFLLLYFKLSDLRVKKEAIFYFSGLLIMLLAESSPLHFIGMHYLFSAHMIIHVILLLICGPLLVLGIPKKKEGSRSFLYKTSLFFNYFPWMGWLAGIAMMWFWHIPAVFDAAFPEMHSSFNLISFLQTASLLLSGIFFSWPVIGPVKHLRINPLVGVLYLFTACIGCSILGLLLTFAPAGIYTHYYLPDLYGFSKLIIDNWGISRADDQQIAGLIMWVPCCFIYLSGSMLLLYRWLNEKEEYQSWQENKLRLERDNL
ncbi:cytochrome c oxidase assembly protein [Rubrolithibacter danxiaensis]|uniref:cytochrome c oxidase assembly protein n=1 Tax=Rubrolithibacter danxiaensis TaxID=3390805 RepID=UPI003BF7DC3B